MTAYLLMLRARYPDDATLRPPEGGSSARVLAGVAIAIALALLLAHRGA